MCSRREFLHRCASTMFLPGVLPRLVRQSLEPPALRNGRVLVVVQLDGGNDGLNTVIPYRDGEYERLRPTLHVPLSRVLAIDDEVGLHPAMRSAMSVLESGRLCIVQGVGYPHPDRSHDVSMGIWQTARFDREEHGSYGWLGRALDEMPPPADGSPDVVHVGSDAPPITMRGRRTAICSVERLEDYALTDVDVPRIGAGAGAGAGDEDVLEFARRSTREAYAMAERVRDVAQRPARGAPYPERDLSRRFALVSRMIQAGFETPVYSIVQRGYDTHSQQGVRHPDLLEDLSDALLAFLDDLSAAGLAERVLVLAFSEFGRRVGENASAGTDHGTAGPVLLAGSRVRSGLIGPAPDLTALEDGDLVFVHDFRRIHAAVLESWLGFPAVEALGGAFEPLPLLAV